jgi:hypothetical protein
VRSRLSTRIPIGAEKVVNRYGFNANRVVRETPTRGITAVGIFLCFGAVMASFAGTTLIWQGSALDRIWALNATAHKQLAPLGRNVGVLFLLLSAALASAGAGWFKRRLWAWKLAVGVLLIQVLGDLVNILMGDLLRGGIGLILAGVLLLYILRPEVRTLFAHPIVSSSR